MRVRQVTAPNVRVIRGNPAPVASVQTDTLPKKRVAAYCRVSTDKDEQETSFEAQKNHFESLISGNPDWELVGIYADEESGTRAEKRDNFMRMIGDCDAGRIDMVLSKSISRWARNTLDSLQYIRKLKAMGIPIIFTKEGINTMDSSGEILVTIMSSLAQQESASISQNVQIGFRYHFQEGKVCAGVHRLLGYNRTPDGSLEIVPEEAEIVQRIFRDYLDGYAIDHIAKRLTAEGVDGSKVTRNGTELPRNWNYGGIDYILQNEKYTGDLLLQKFYTVDFLTKKSARNTGQIPQYLVENSHDPIIPKEVFTQVQAEMARRKKHWQDFRYVHKTVLAGKVFCGNCGTPYRRVQGTWRCEARLNRKRFPDITCDMESVKGKALEQAVVDAFNQLPEKKEDLIRLEERIRWGGLNRADEVLTAIEAEMKALEDEIHETEEKGDNDTAITARQRLEETRNQWADASEQRAVYADKALQIRNLLDRIKLMEEGQERYVYRLSPNGRCEKPETFFRLTRPECPEGPVMECRDDDVIRYLEKIVVYPDRLAVSFKAGITVDIPRTK